MPVILKALVVQHLFHFMVYDAGLTEEFFLGTHRSPLKRCKRLGDKKGGTGNDLNLAGPLVFGDLIIPLCNLLRKKSDPFDIFCSLRRQSEHKIQLDPVPAALKGLKRPV